MSGNQHDANAEAAALLIRHRAALYGFIFSCVRNHADVEDILQDVSLTVIRSFSKLAEPAGFVAWAREIARRHVLAHLRNKQRLEVISPELIEVLHESAERIDQQAVVPHRMEALVECLESLPQPMREIITQRYDGSVQGVQELARKIGRTLDATYGLLKRARSAVRDCVERKLAQRDQP